jgi:hypothetical protein
VRLGHHPTRFPERRTRRVGKRAANSRKKERTMIKRKSNLLVAVALLTAPFFAGVTAAGENGRHIHINGQHMTPVQIATLDAINCGEAVPNGNYWVNWANRAWGYEGGPQQGWLPNCQRRESSASASRYVEDRIFERSGVSIIQNPVYQ